MHCAKFCEINSISPWKKTDKTIRRKSEFKVESGKPHKTTEQAAEVIWQRPYRTPYFLAVGDGDLHLVQCFLGSQESLSETWVDPFSRFCTTRPRDRQTDWLTDTRIIDNLTYLMPFNNRFKAEVWCNSTVVTWSRLLSRSMMETSSVRLPPWRRRARPLTDVDGPATQNSSSISLKLSPGGLQDVPLVQTLWLPSLTRRAGIFTHWRRRRRERGVGVIWSVVGDGTPSLSTGDSGGGGGGGGGMRAFVFAIISNSVSQPSW